MTPAKDEILAELTRIEGAQRGIIRHNAYFGSHRGYIANQERRQELLRQLRELPS